MKIGVVEQKQIQRISTIECQAADEKKESKCLSPDCCMMLHMGRIILCKTSAKSVLVFSSR